MDTQTYYEKILKARQKTFEKLNCKNCMWFSSYTGQIPECRNIKIEKYAEPCTGFTEIWKQI